MNPHVKMEEMKKERCNLCVFSELLDLNQSLKTLIQIFIKKFIHEKEILDLLKVIDGSETDENLLSFLEYDKLKDGKMCRHLVCVFTLQSIL